MTDITFKQTKKQKEKYTSKIVDGVLIIKIPQPQRDIDEFIDKEKLK